MSMATPSASYTPTTDAMDRHEYGVTKSRKAASTGGGRAWSEDEVRCLPLLIGKEPLRPNTHFCRESAVKLELETFERYVANQTLPHTGSLSSPNSPPEDAVQTHRRPPEEDRTRLPLALPPAQPRQQPPQAYHQRLQRLLDRRSLANFSRHRPVAYPRARQRHTLALGIAPRLRRLTL